MKTIFLFALLYLPASVFASGTTIGNGGFVLSCSTKTEIFDRYEIETKGNKVESVPGHNLDEKIENLLARLERIDPNRAQSFRYQYKEFWSGNIDSLPIEGLHLTSDLAAQTKYQRQFGLGLINIPQNCELVLALQQMPATQSNRGRTRISIRLFKPVWDRLDLDTQAALVIHELFYREYILRNFALNSKGVRYLTGLLLSDKFQTLTKEAWITELLSVEFSAMFPDFKLGPAGSVNDLEADFGAPDYRIYGGKNFGNSFQGHVNLQGDISLNVTAATDLFLKGLYPEVFTLSQPQILDLSGYSKDILKLNVATGSPECEFKIDKNLRLRLMGIEEKYWVLGASCKSYLDTYANPNIQFSGPIKAYYAQVNRTKNIPTLILLKSEFSILQIKQGNQWKDVNRAQINLQNGNAVAF
ncbi:MAG TPA: hypothetical protein VN132_15865 [Bdellovibrio sp.]|nr:hypothetical protein [Bdellovibrio sp.]